MKDQLESNLRDALRPVDPGELFAERVVARLSDRPAEVVAEPIQARRWYSSRAIRRWVPTALAASLVAAMLVRHELQLRQELEEGRIAREQLLEALRMTSEKLDVAYRAVNPPRPEPRERGANDNTI